MPSSGLTREEECVLRTAVAFVIIKARRNEKRVLEEAPTNDSCTSEAKTTRPKRHPDENVAEQDAASSLVKAPQPTSILDRLFQYPLAESWGGNVTQGHRALLENQLIRTQKQAFLQCQNDCRHLQQMFHAARTLARSVLEKRALKKSNDATGDRYAGATCSDEMALYGAAGHLANQLQLLLIRPTPFSSSESSRKFNSAEERSLQSEKEGGKAGHGSRMSPESSAQEWIRNSLLQSINSTGSNPTINTLKEDTWDLLAAFHVYEIIVPQLPLLSPPLVGHIFQVATKLIRDLYDDKIVIQKRPKEGSMDHKRLLDCLATSTLRLLETCWISKAGHSSGENKHQAFMVGELQFRLGDLLVPISLQQIPITFRDLCMKQKEHKNHVRMVARAHARGKAANGSLVSPRPSCIPPNVSQHLPLYTLDPGAKLIVRMAIFRLLMLK